MIRMYVSRHLSGSYHRPTLQSFLLPDVVTWLAPTCDVVNTSSAPTAFRRLCYWLMLVPFPLSMPSPALFTTISYGWVGGHRSITSSLDCIWLHGILLYGLPRCFTSSECILRELLSLWVEYVLAGGVLLKWVANRLHHGINIEMNVAPLQVRKESICFVQYLYLLGTGNTANKMSAVGIMARTAFSITL